MEASNTPTIRRLTPSCRHQLSPIAPEERSETKPGDISGEPCPIQPRDRASITPSPCRICVAHAEFVAALAGASPRAIPLDIVAADLEDRAEHLTKVLTGLSAYVRAILAACRT